MLRNNIAGVALLTAAIVGVSLHGVALASSCKGMEKSKCESTESCYWVDAYQRKDGVEVSGHCRGKPGSKKSSKQESDNKSDSSSRTGSSGQSGTKSDSAAASGSKSHSPSQSSSPASSKPSTSGSTGTTKSDASTKSDTTSNSSR